MGGVLRMVGGKKVFKNTSWNKGCFYGTKDSYTFLRASISPWILSTSFVLAVSVVSQRL